MRTQVRVIRPQRTRGQLRSADERGQFENIWLRTKRRDTDGKVHSGTGGVCYLYFPTRLSARQRHVLRNLGIC